MATSASVEKHMQAIVQGFRPDKASGLNVTYQLQLTGGGAGTWTVTVASGRCMVGPGVTAKPDTAITMDADHFLDLAAGRLNVKSAYQKGEIRVAGNLNHALRFTEIFPAWAALVPPDAPSAPPQPPTPTPEPPAKPTSPALADYVRAMPSGFRQDKAGGLRATYQFQLAGSDGGSWTVTVANNSCTVAEGQTASPSVVINMNSNDFIRLARGQLNTNQAFQQGQIRVSGDLKLAARIPDIFRDWAKTVEAAPTPAPPPTPTPTQPPKPAPTPTPPPTPAPPPAGPVHSTLLNGSFDEYQPYVRDGEAKVWKEAQFPEQYGAQWQLKVISEGDSRLHLMDSGTFGRFTQKYFGGGGRDYHIHGRHSQVVTSRYSFDLVFMQTVTAQPGREYNFSGSIVSFYKGTSGERADGKIFKTLGVDPTGGQDFRSPSVIWGERDGKDNEWRYPSLRVKAQSPALTVFIRLENTEKDVGQTELNIIHLENFKLE